ncbi:MAG: 4-hydroxythreonine-4-phosphate dehydrogenase PdxA [Candidatus Lokiarchaeota archaeon]|nr:4-hydroxythreonine-4-phosphate dehydrogenase PdxA [Candidatus Lokiarchaeota archaeon]MBD3341104.1 4-hydroxythreonine-4-phosphate dehydrogenase PdxA [Candidatus Lokiarchaeota archaeon]
MKPVLGILLGDATGIGPEILAKISADGRITSWCRPILIGDARVLRMGMKFADVQFPFSVIDDLDQIDLNGPFPLLDLHNFDPSHSVMGQVSANSGRAMGQQFECALELYNKGIINGLCFAPYNKAALEQGGYNIYKLFARNLKISWPFGELNVVNNLWVSRVTSHIPLREVPNRLTVKKILGAIRLLNKTIILIGIDQPRIAVASINPHAGEEELFGKEENEIIAPAIALANKKGINAIGPFPADTIFLNAFKGLYDGVTTMYHDQGQIALKLMNFESAVTVIAGLSCPITTPAHGTAFDIAGKGKANPNAMTKAIEIAATITKKKL